MYSSRFKNLPEVNRLTLRRRQLEAADVPILDLTASNPTRAGLELPGDPLLAALQNRELLSYDPCPRGSASAREAVAGYYRARGWQVSPSQLMLTCSTSEAYCCLFKLLADPGDRILTPRPSYPLFEHLALAESLRSATYPLLPAADWGVDLQALEGDLRLEPTRALVLVHPNNPTGSMIHQDEWAAIRDLCVHSKTPVIFDEVFYDYRFQEAGDLRLDQQDEVLTFVLNGLSKTAALPQMKAAWILVLGPPPEVDRAIERLELILDTYLSLSATAEAVLTAALPNLQLRQAAVKRRLEENLKRLRAVLAGTAAELLEPSGGWSAVLRLPRVRSEEEWVLRLLEKHSVLVHPGYFYDFPEEAYLIISLLTPPGILDPALERLRSEL